MPTCTDCGGTVIEYDTAAGNGFCVQCGTVVEENTIVNEVTFGETSSGAAMVQGSFVGQGATHARMSGPYGNRGSGESREQTIANAAKRIQNIASVLRLSEVVCLAATRLYTLAVEHRFTKGRKSLNVVAVCLYVACRQKETRNYMLIDFSDLLQVNVFELGHTYLQLVQTLNLRLPLVDPSHYISRFASLLEFGDETSKVATDAVRLVQRFDRDWMTRGRRPAGICGAALLLAGRMNNFRRSIEEIVQVVKIADSTVRKRLEEFRRSPSGSLTVEDFRKVWLEEEMDPPAFTKGREREEREKLALEEREREGEEGVTEGWGDEEEEAARAKRANAKGKGKAKQKSTKMRKGKRKRGEDSDEEEEDADEDQLEESEHQPKKAGPPVRQPIDPALLNQGILAGSVQPQQPSPSAMTNGQAPLFSLPPIEDDDEDVRMRMNVNMMNESMNMSLDPNIDPQLLQQVHSLLTAASASASATGLPPLPEPLPVPGPSINGSTTVVSNTTTPPSTSTVSLPPPPTISSLTALGINVNPNALPMLTPQEALAEETVSTLVAEEVEEYLRGTQGMMIVEALNEAEERKKRGRAGKEVEREQERGQELGGEGAGGEVVMEDTSVVDASMTVLSPSQTDVDSAAVVLGQRGDVGSVGLGLETPGASTSAATASATALGASTSAQTQAQVQATNGAGCEDIEDELKGLDEEELDWFLLSPEEVKIKERVWVELNRDYLEAIAAKNLQAEQGMSNSRSRKKRKTTTKPRDATTPHGTTAAESVRNLLKKNPKYSKRINYDALKDLFVDQPDKELMSRFGGDTTMLSMDDDDDVAGGGGGKMDRMSVASGFGSDKSSRGRRGGMMDEDEDDEERRLIVVIEDESHAVPARRPVSRTTVAAGSVGKDVARKGVVGADEDAEGDVDEEEDDELVVGGWEDAYEQEV